MRPVPKKKWSRIKYRLRWRGRTNVHRRLFLLPPCMRRVCMFALLTVLLWHAESFFYSEWLKTKDSWPWRKIGCTVIHLRMRYSFFPFPVFFFLSFHISVRSIHARDLSERLGIGSEGVISANIYDRGQGASSLNGWVFLLLCHLFSNEEK